MHWVLCVVIVEQKRIWFWDSCGSKGRGVCATILRYLNNEHQTKNQGQQLPQEWLTSYDSRQLQGNGVDCGAFICTTIYLLLSKQELNFIERQMITARKRIALSILRLRNDGDHIDIASQESGVDAVATSISSSKLKREWQQPVTTGGSNNNTTTYPMSCQTVVTSSNAQEVPASCFYYPFCQRGRALCRGTRRNSCVEVNEEEMLRMNGLTYDGFLEVKRVAKNQLRAKRARADYEGNKVAKQKLSS